LKFDDDFDEPLSARVRWKHMEKKMYLFKFAAKANLYLVPYTVYDKLSLKYLKFLRFQGVTLLKFHIQSKSKNKALTKIVAK